MTRARAQRKRIYHRASAIARDIRTADFPDAVNIVARLIAGPMTRRRQPATLTVSTNTLKDDPMTDADRELWRRANPCLAPSNDVVMVGGTLPVSAPLARELVADGVLTRMARKIGEELELPPGHQVEFSSEPLIDSYVDGDGRLRPHMRDQVEQVICDSDCPRRRASWPGCCKLAADERPGPDRWVCNKCGEARRRSECLSCGNREAITDEPRTSGLVR